VDRRQERTADRPDVGFFLPSFGGGGVERVVLNLAGALARRGRRVDLVLMRAEGALLDQLPPGIRVVDLRAPTRHDALFATSLPALVAYLRRSAPGVLYSGMTTVNLIALWARRLARAPTAIVVSEHVPVSVNASTHPLKRVLPFLARLNYGGADAVVAVAEALADDLARTARLPRAGIDVVHNPVVTPGLLAGARSVPAHPWFAPGADVPVILGIGRLAPQKDFANLIEAFALVRRERPARLLILGEGPDRAALEASVRRLGLGDDVALPGFVPDPASYLGHAALFALSSTFEGFPTVLIEALACGCPVVSTACPTGPDEILMGGTYGRLVPVRDPQALAQATLATLAAPLPRADAMRRGAEFTVDAVVPRYEALFDRVLAARREAGVAVV
jgi:glycosyltransferase involved in cell wall biosynthesis